MDNQPGVNDGLRELALFAGAGGGILVGLLLGWRTVCAVEIEPYPASVLVARQNEGILPPFPIWDDVCTFDGKPWRGIVDVVSGGFPCQDISSAGKGAGIEGAKSGLWKEMARIIGEVRPRFAFVENSPMLVGRGLGTVLGDLAEMGYDAEWGVFSAAECGAPHLRERIFIMAFDSNKINDREKQKVFSGGEVANSSGICEKISDTESSCDGSGEWWSTEPNVGRVVNGLAGRVDRLKAIGNGQVCAVVKLAWETLMERIQANA